MCSPQLENVDKFEKKAQFNHLSLALQIFVIGPQTQIPQLPEETKRLLQEYDGIFQEPTGLPPSQAQDRNICLIEGAQLECVRPN